MTEGSSATAKAGQPPGWITPMLMGVLICMSAWILHEMERIYTEVRVLQEHVSNTNAVLIREGIKKPNDDQGTGPTGNH